MALMLPNSVFFHIPKTGGTWVRKAIAYADIPRVELEHSSDQAKNQHNRYWQVDTGKKFTFAFVRHPVSWYASFWSYRMFTGWRFKSSPDYCMSIDFETFVRKLLDRCPAGFVTEQYKQFLGPTSEQLDFVGRIETLADDLVTALKQAGETFDEKVIRSTPRHNRSPLRPRCSESLRKEILKVEKGVLERFGYH